MKLIIAVAAVVAATSILAVSTPAAAQGIAQGLPAPYGARVSRACPKK
jgi:hypothetical protein